MSAQLVRGRKVIAGASICGAGVWRRRTTRTIVEKDTFVHLHTSKGQYDIYCSIIYAEVGEAEQRDIVWLSHDTHMTLSLGLVSVLSHHLLESHIHTKRLEKEFRQNNNVRSLL